MSKLGGEKGLPGPANHTGLLHRMNAGEDDVEGNARLLGDMLEREALKTTHKIFRDLEDLRVDGVVSFDRDFRNGFGAHGRAT